MASAGHKQGVYGVDCYARNHGQDVHNGGRAWTGGGLIVDAVRVQACKTGCVCIWLLDEHIPVIRLFTHRAEDDGQMVCPVVAGRCTTREIAVNAHNGEAPRQINATGYRFLEAQVIACNRCGHKAFCGQGASKPVRLGLVQIVRVVQLSGQVRWLHDIVVKQLQTPNAFAHQGVRNVGANAADANDKNLRVGEGVLREAWDFLLSGSNVLLILRLRNELFRTI